MYRIISKNQVVAICDRFRWVRMMDGVLVGTIKATAQGFEARVPVAEGESYHFEKKVYALEPGGLTGTEPVGQIVEFHGAVDLQDKDTVLNILAGDVVDKQEAKTMRGFIEQAAEGLDDATASQAPNLFPGLKEDGSLVRSGTRINWKGVVKRAAVDLWDTVDNNPNNAPGLWEDLPYIDGIRVIPDIITVGLAFSKGEKGWWDGILYESLMDANVYTPEAYPAGWQEVG